MMYNTYELTIKQLSGEELTDDEKKYLHERNAKYEIVRYVYMEKMKHEGLGLNNFQFTPGDSFGDTPIIDIVNELLKFNEAIKNGDYEIVDFDDEAEFGNPPHTGREKKTL